MTLPTLYKMDNKGKVRQWSIEVVEKFNNGNGAWIYRQIHGVKGGKLQSTQTSIFEGKNAGKSNETSAKQQCELEAKALWTKQKDRKGYTVEIPTEKPFGPMLAKSYDKDGKHIKFPCYVQPKLDGLRCLAKVKNGTVTLWSRQNKQFKVLQHIEEELKEFPDGIYDGELYLHGQSFQTIVGAIKRDEKNKNTEKIEYHIYDLINKENFKDRYNKIRNISINIDGKIKWVSTLTCQSKQELKDYHDVFVEQGYEGIMLRNQNGLYKIGGRSADLQKYKIFQDEEFPIIGAEECIGKMEGMCTFKCDAKNGGTFDVMPEGSEEERRQYWNNWCDGKITSGDLLTVKYFGWTDTVPPVPRFPIGKGIRID